VLGFTPTLGQSRVTTGRISKLEGVKGNKLKEGQRGLPRWRKMLGGKKGERKRMNV
jgi:hypothetical protein